MTEAFRIPAEVDLVFEGRQLSLLIQSVTDYAIYMLDPEGHVRSWNAGGHRIKGYQHDEIVGQHFSRFYVPEDVERGLPMKGLETARREGKYEAEGWRLRKDGSRFRASVVIDPIWQHGELVGYAKVTRDITERYEAGLRLQDAQKALVQSQKIEAIGKLTFGLAHDFNNLLTVVINSLDLISMRPGADARTLQLVDTAMRAADRGALLTRQLLSFARGQNLVAERHNLNNLLSHSIELYRRTCGPTVEFVLDLGADMPEVLVDAAQFEASMMNLVANSRDAMPRGGRISISTHLANRAAPDDPNGISRDYVCVGVADNGVGMPADVVERAIEPFYTTKEVGKGSGLGLSQVFGFASQSGGFATLESRENEGTVIHVCLPRIQD
ncbi:PAS domain S-box protein [Pseudoxanthomonas gei]|uniref:histidine kinase n=1 Tax=Pseudoxanthomonas gei TaxID=1383030 RepID=A0ABX0AAH6_9GAMM|nr:PAS domain-containing sensor histidine kinase [Pseudoxanthomonas gei]NDK38555.1 PAS domain S-box protein [Pseudoxanthomonas gei]